MNSKSLFSPLRTFVLLSALALTLSANAAVKDTVSTTVNVGKDIRVYAVVTSESPRTCALRGAWGSDGKPVNCVSDNTIEADLELPSNIQGYAVTAIQDYALYWTSFTSLVIPEGVTSIGRCGCYSIYALTKAVLPSTIKELDLNTFFRCSKLRTVIIKAVNPPTLKAGSNDQSFNLIASGAVLYVPNPENYKVEPWLTWFGEKNIRAIADDTALTEHVAGAAESPVWYDLTGRMFNQRPNTPGLYLNNGRKVMVK